MLIDCTTCVARDIACADCVVTVLLSTPPPRTAPPPRIAPPPVALDICEQEALGLLAQAGLVPPLRLVRPVEHGTDLAGTA